MQQYSGTGILMTDIIYRILLFVRGESFAVASLLFHSLKNIHGCNNNGQF